MTLRMVEMVVREATPVETAALSEEVQALGVWREQLHDDHVLLRLLVPSDKTETVIEVLEKRFQSSPGFRLFIFEVQATVPQPEVEKASAAKEAEGEANGEAKDQASGGAARDAGRIACDELVQTLAQGAAVNRVFVVTVVLSVVVSAIGLIRDDVAVIIGAMVIAPLLTPNMTLSLATTLGDLKLARRALAVNGVGISVSLAVAVLIGASVTVDPSVRQIAMRTEVALSDVALALAAGSAGALAFTTGLSTAVVGVMVAVALLPPVVNVGLLLGGGYPYLAAGAALLSAVNIVCINLAGVATFLWQDVTPRHWWKAERARRMVRLAAGVWFGLLGLLVLLIYLGQGWR